MRPNLILDTDSYKASHWVQYPFGTEGMYSYFESRGGAFDATVWFGLQYVLKEYLTTPITMADVDEADAFFRAHGEPFNREGWAGIVRDHGGYLPVRIRSVEEGTVVPTHNVLMSVESTDPRYFWVVSWLETLLVRLWYPTTVATLSHEIGRVIRAALDRSADAPEAEFPFKLHDFGGRGVACREQAGIGGMAHLVNFKGSDTVEGVRFANHYYGCEGGMAGFSIPAAEHSTITSWGRAGEVEAYRNMLGQFARPGALVACVSDSYDVFAAVENLWCGTLLDEVKASGATVVIRPDSGDPCDVVMRLLALLERKVGMAVNTKGFKVLPNYFRIIQGDGVELDSIRRILDAMLAAGYSASNIAFGCGGALLQKVNRDTQKFAFKCSSVTIDGRAVDVRKEPVTDPGKRSKAGRLSLVRNAAGTFETVVGDRSDNLLHVVFENGRLVETTTFDAVRARVAGLPVPLAQAAE